MSEDTPKLHGWITPEYAMEMVEEMLEWLNKQKIYAKIYYEIYEPKLIGWRNVSNF